LLLTEFHLLLLTQTALVNWMTYRDELAHMLPQRPTVLTNCFVA